MTYSWHHADGHLPSRSRGRVTNTLSIHEVNPHDTGMYYCIAMKNGISTESNRAIVSVDGKELLHM